MYCNDQLLRLTSFPCIVVNLRKYSQVFIKSFISKLEHNFMIDSTPFARMIICWNAEVSSTKNHATMNQSLEIEYIHQ